MVVGPSSVPEAVVSQQASAPCDRSPRKWRTATMYWRPAEPCRVFQRPSGTRLDAVVAAALGGPECRLNEVGQDLGGVEVVVGDQAGGLRMMSVSSLRFLERRGGLVDRRERKDAFSDRECCGEPCVLHDDRPADGQDSRPNGN